MPTIHIDIRDGYDVQIADRVLARLAEFLAPRFSPRQAALVTDAAVDRLYADVITAGLTAAGWRVAKKVFPAGERAKTLANYQELLGFLADENFTKSDVVLALGGGVIGDLAGFAAATFLRGLNFLQLPTTLLAMVDSSVGGKTAVNLPQGKNLVGAFYQPHFVLADTATLATLPPENFADGAAEIIKYGVLADAPLFAELAAGKLRENLTAIIARAVALKRDYVVADEHDRGKRQELNLGHTFGHAVEKLSDFRIPHGHAVAIGMALIARGAARQNFCDAEVPEKIAAVLRRYDLPTASPFPPAAIVAAAANDKKRRGGQITLVLPRRIGECVLQTVDVKELENYLI
ncbi:MAG: 3-dehydroquinate synthase [Planctomycetota bacterium]|jgi:3-dehydroquinate synthase|nr:3-dehydroquinate synthase [Planctomycetota bacterium]